MSKTMPTTRMNTDLTVPSVKRLRKLSVKAAEAATAPEQYLHRRSERKSSTIEKKFKNRSQYGHSIRTAGGCAS
jgi:hypothetical protein